MTSTNNNDQESKEATVVLQGPPHRRREPPTNQQPTGRFGQAPTQGDAKSPPDMAAQVIEQAFNQGWTCFPFHIGPESHDDRRQEAWTFEDAFLENDAKEPGRILETVGQGFCFARTPLINIRTGVQNIVNRALDEEKGILVDMPFPLDVKQTRRNAVWWINADKGGKDRFESAVEPLFDRMLVIHRRIPEEDEVALGWIQVFPEEIIASAKHLDTPPMRAILEKIEKENWEHMQAMEGQDV